MGVPASVTRLVLPKNDKVKGNPGQNPKGRDGVLQADLVRLTGSA